jgi:23S rRNA (guanine745-N1)-methyltransferase
VTPRPTAAPEAPWRCPVCRASLRRRDDGRRWSCPAGHSFDVAREGYVNLLRAGPRRSRQPGDSPEMVQARRRFLATGAYDPLSSAVAGAVAAGRPSRLLDVGCGEGRHTRALTAPLVLGIDVAKPAVAAAARSHPDGCYAVASAADVPLAEACVDAVVNVFGPVMAAELARVVRPGGVVVAAHPGPDHLEELRRLVYAEARPHEVKSPLRSAREWFVELGSEAIVFPVVVTDPSNLEDLFAMTPYRWHAPPDIKDRLAAAASSRFETVADVRVTAYRRSEQCGPHHSSPAQGSREPRRPEPRRADHGRAEQRGAEAAQ